MKMYKNNALKGVRLVPGTWSTHFWKLPRYSLPYCLYQFRELGMIIFILQLRKLRPREVEWLAWITQLVRCGAGIWTQALWRQSSCSPPLCTPLLPLSARCRAPLRSFYHFVLKLGCSFYRCGDWCWLPRSLIFHKQNLDLKPPSPDFRFAFPLDDSSKVKPKDV